MKRLLTLATTTVTALLMVPVGALAHEPGDAGSGDEPNLILYAQEESFTAFTASGEVVSEDEEFVLPAVGDQFFVVDALHSTAERDDWVGRNSARCTVTEVAGTFPSPEDFETLEPGDDIPEFRLTQMCDGVVTIYGQGTLTWAGAGTFTDEDLEAELAEGYDPYAEPFITVAITGGTWEFIGASGQVSVYDEEAPDDETSWTRYEVTLL